MFELKSGSILGRYEILTRVAEGGMATVWAARQQGMHGFSKLVAIKTMLPGMSEDPDFEAMFLDEARLASQIRHPHVVEIIDLGEEREVVYLVMEWINGDTLFTLNKRARKQGGIPLPILLRIASDACGGLHAAHELRNERFETLQLVHRDVSPQNVMISFDGIVKLVDFGVAKAIGRGHETRVSGLMKGKVPYLSPEQLVTGGKIDRRSDIFALGILLYVMVTGRHPFRGESDAKTMENILTRLPVPISELVPDVNRDLEEIVLKALKKEPSERWQTCAELQRALNEVQAHAGAPVNEGDVASFVRDLMGDLIAERQDQLSRAIDVADLRAAGGGPTPQVHTPVRSQQPKAAAARPGAAGTPLPATYNGFLPVALDEKSALTSTPPPPIAALVPVVSAGRRRRSSLVWILAGVILLLVGGAVAAVFAGVLV